MIYVVEDDADIRALEEYALRGAGYEVAGFADAGHFLAACEKQLPELAVLDVMLPGMDGFALLARLRSQGETLPVMMVTAKSAELDVVTGLEGGADDYLAKPFGVMEFISRVKALLRRAHKPAEGPLAFGPIAMDEERREVHVDGRLVELTFKEYALLRLFLQHPEKVLPREQILQSVWGTDFEGESRTLDMHVRTLRQKLGDAGAAIVTVRKVGYRLCGEGQP